LIPLFKIQDDDQNKTIQMRAAFPNEGGPYPVILFSHYLHGTKDDYNKLIEFWASHGYVCFVPNHADSPQIKGSHAPQSSMGWRERAEDIRFLVETLAKLEQLDSRLEGKLDLSCIGLGGHLIGAHSTGLVAGMKMFGPDGSEVSYNVPGIDALLMMSPTGRGQGLTDQSWEDLKIPMMVMTGSKSPSRRTSNPPEWRLEPFTYAAPGNKYLVFIEGMDGTYGELFGESPQPNEFANYVMASTLAFWEAHLKTDEKAVAFLSSDQLITMSAGAVTFKRR
jgi:hypothetical protein